MSISGQNERWAQLNAYQPPPSSQAGANGGWATESGGTTGSAGSAGGASGGLSDTMSLALMAFSGAWGTGSGTSPQAPGPNGGTAIVPSTDPPSSTQDASGIGSQLLNDMQSMMATLTGTADASPAPGSEGFQQQFAFSAYAANSSSLTNPATAPLTSINV